MNFGPAEAFTPEQMLHLYEINCVGCHRILRRVLPEMRRQHFGLLIWISSSSAHGPGSPWLAGYFAAKAAQDSLAQTYALEVSKWGIESSIVVPGIFTKGTSHFASAMQPSDKEREKLYLGPGAKYEGWDKICLEGSGKLVNEEEGDPQLVADAVVSVVAAPYGKRPWRVHVEPDMGCGEDVNAVRDVVRQRYLKRMGCASMLEVDTGGNN